MKEHIWLHSPLFIQSSSLAHTHSHLVLQLTVCGAVFVSLCGFLLVCASATFVSIVIAQHVACLIDDLLYTRLDLIIVSTRQQCSPLVESDASIQHGRQNEGPSLARTTPSIWVTHTRLWIK